jgi:hypothetical protein
VKELMMETTRESNGTRVGTQSKGKRETEAPAAVPRTNADDLRALARALSIAPSATQLKAPDDGGLLETLLPIVDADDHARKQFIVKAWESRLDQRQFTSLQERLKSDSLRPFSGGQTWRNLFWFVFPPPTSMIYIYAAPGTRWRIFGGGIPFYLEGTTDERGFSEQWIGWGVLFISVDALDGPNGNAKAIFSAFPDNGNRPPAGPPNS